MRPGSLPAKLKSVLFIPIIFYNIRFRLMRFRSLFLVVSLLFAHVSARASIDMFLNVENVPGESRDSAHAGQCDVLAWSWGMSNSGRVSPGGPGTGRASVQDLSVTKYVDKASTLLMLGCAKGTHYPKATLYLRKAGAQASQNFLVIIMEDVLVTSMSTGGSGGEDRLTENVSFNFGKVTVNYWEQRSDGSYVQGKPFAWDLVNNVEP